MADEVTVIPETEDWYGHQVSPQQAKMLRLMTEGNGMNAKAALYALGHSLAMLSQWTRESEAFKAARKMAEEVVAHHQVIQGDEILDAAAGEIQRLKGDDIKKASAIANLARSRAEYRFRVGSRLDSKKWGEKVQHDGASHGAITLYLPQLAAQQQLPEAQFMEHEELVHVPKVPALKAGDE